MHTEFKVSNHFTRISVNRSTRVQAVSSIPLTRTNAVHLTSKSIRKPHLLLVLLLVSARPNQVNDVSSALLSFLLLLLILLLLLPFLLSLHVLHTVHAQGRPPTCIRSVPGGTKVARTDVVVYLFTLFNSQFSFNSVLHM